MKIINFLIKVLSVIVIIIVCIVLIRAFDSRSLPDLKKWHTELPMPEPLQNTEFDSFESFVHADVEYVKSNFKLVKDTTLGRFQRYNPQNQNYPFKNYNASFVLDPGKEKTKAIIILIHGLSDSPYHMYDLAQYFYDKDYYVFALRLPGHGTLPSGLLNVTWQQWYDAVNWSMQKASVLAKDRNNIPVHMGGFSTGGALCLYHSFMAVNNSEMLMPDKVFLFSPAAGVDPLAVVSAWHKSLSWVPYFHKFAWLDILPEYDPAKYSSFTKNAGRQIFLLCEENKKLAKKISNNKMQAVLPAIISFESWVDATVNINDLIQIYNYVANDDDCLVLFDVNRKYSSFMKTNIEKNSIQSNLSIGNNFDIHIITNKVYLEDYSDLIGVYSYNNGDKEELYSADTNYWQPNTFAISHISVPISPQNHLYGKESVLSNIQMHGEKGVLIIPSSDISRLRYNPFFDIMTSEINTFLDL